MNINELNAKLVSELREIARLIGIPDVDKLRKQELVSKIVETGEEEARNAAKEKEAAAVAEEPVVSDKPKRRTRTVKVVEPVGARSTKDDYPGEQRESAVSSSESRAELPQAAARPASNGNKIEGPTTN